MQIRRKTKEEKYKRKVDLGLDAKRLMGRKTFRVVIEDFDSNEHSIEVKADSIAIAHALARKACDPLKGERVFYVTEVE